MSSNAQLLMPHAAMMAKTTGKMDRIEDFFAGGGEEGGEFFVSGVGRAMVEQGSRVNGSAVARCDQ